MKTGGGGIWDNLKLYNIQLNMGNTEEIMNGSGEKTIGQDKSQNKTSVGQTGTSAKN